MPAPELPGEVYEIADRFRRDLLQRERAAASRMVHEYGAIWKQINGRIRELSREYYSGEGKNAHVWLNEFDRLRILRSQVEGEITRFAQHASAEIKGQQWEAVSAAGVHTEQMVTGQLPPNVNIGFYRLPREALTDLVGFLSDGSPLADLLGELGPEAGKAVADKLVQGLALGLHPRQVALECRQAMGLGLTRALRIARTETLRAYREATHRTYGANSDIIGGWIWRSARNERTCAMCWAMDGTEHGLDERLDDHINGRCFQVPKTKTWKDLGFDIEETRYRTRSTGVEAFEKLDDVKKLRILGLAKFTAYQDGLIKLDDLIGRRYSRRWGTMRYEKSLAEVVRDKVRRN